MKKKTLVFVCVENACRSQIAEAFAKMLGDEIAEVYSAGSRPAGKVNEKAIASMKALAYDMGSHRSKGLDALPEITFDWLVTMGCGDLCPSIHAKQRETWNIPDPKNLEVKGFNLIRDRIRQNVTQLIEEIQNRALPLIEWVTS